MLTVCQWFGRIACMQRSVPCASDLAGIACANVWQNCLYVDSAVPVVWQNCLYTGEYANDLAELPVPVIWQNCLYVDSAVPVVWQNDCLYAEP
jgi:hypothetical protein